MAAYEMFTEEGDKRVEAIVQRVLTDYADEPLEVSFSWACNLLDELSQEEGFHEAYDTAVRDAVWEAMGSTLGMPRAPKFEDASKDPAIEEAILNIRTAIQRIAPIARWATGGGPAAELFEAMSELEQSIRFLNGEEVPS